MQERICPYCGAHLDPGEKCDCQVNEKKTDVIKEMGKKCSTKGNQIQERIKRL